MDPLMDPARTPRDFGSKEEPGYVDHEGPVDPGGPVDLIGALGDPGEDPEGTLWGPGCGVGPGPMGPAVMSLEAWRLTGAIPKT